MTPSFPTPFRCLAAALALTLAACTPTASETADAPPPAADGGLLIDNARIADGSGGPISVGDVRVRDGRIVEIGDLAPAPQERVIDAQGLVLAPGFIDTHSHHDDGILDHPEAAEAVSQGITTIVVGQDGSSSVPLADFLARLEARPVAVNLASYSGHNTLRGQVLGKDFKRHATAEELARMQALLQADLDAGAIGLSTGLEYDPGIYSDHAEVLALARTAAASGGRYISHIRSEDRDPWSAIDELLAIGREASIPVQVSHMKLAAIDWWGDADRLLRKLDAARAEGIQVSADVYPYTYWQSTLKVLWPERDFDNPETAKYVLEHLAPPDGLLLAGYSADPSLVGKTVADIARERGTDPVATVMDLLKVAEETEGSVGVIGTSMDEDDIRKFLLWPHTNISSDGGLGDRHPRGAGAFTRVLARYVRDEGLLPLEAAVHKMTGLAADHMGIADRGRIREGAYADLVLFDPDAVADRATTREPGLLSVGIAKVWVNGTLVLEDGVPTGAHPGHIVRRAPASR